MSKGFGDWDSDGLGRGGGFGVLVQAGNGMDGWDGWVRWVSCDGCGIDAAQCQ